jgi:hypothetical protein
MKIRGSGPSAPTGAPEGSQGTQGTDKTGGPNFADRLDKTTAAGATAAPEKASAPSGGPPRKLTGDIGAKLEKGQISTNDALDQVVSRILDKQIAAGAPPTTRAKVETALRDALETDPVLTAKVRTLSSAE